MIAVLISRAAEWLLSLSARARIQLVSAGLLLLGGGGIYKLISSVRAMQEPLPAATPMQLIKPMESLVKQTSANISDYRIERNLRLKRLDSLKINFSTKPKTDR